MCFGCAKSALSYEGSYMTTQIITGENDIAVVCSAIDVENYLHNHPEFFVDHPELLVQLEVPHPAGGAVSLIERQVALIRQENKQHRERIRELVEIARSNENIVEKLHRLSVDLIGVNSLDGYIDKLKQQLCDNFSANHIRIVLYSERFGNQLEKSEFVSRADKELSNFDNILTNRQAICGRFNEQQLQFLFADAAADVESMALIPLLDDEPIGFLAIGNANVDHFKAGMSTSLLSSLGDISSAVLSRIMSE